MTITREDTSRRKSLSGACRLRRSTVRHPTATRRPGTPVTTSAKGTEILGEGDGRRETRPDETGQTEETTIASGDDREVDRAIVTKTIANETAIVTETIVTVTEIMNDPEIAIATRGIEIVRPEEIVRHAADRALREDTSTREVNAIERKKTKSRSREKSRKSPLINAPRGMTQLIETPLLYH